MRIIKDIYNAKLKEYKEQQYDLGAEKEELTKADENYHITIKTVLNIAKKAEKIFEGSEIEEKTEFLKFLLQNRIVDGKKPLFKMKEPFLSISKASNHPTLLRIVNNVRTKIELNNEYFCVPELENLPFFDNLL